jgi:hypothetical protein
MAPYCGSFMYKAVAKQGRGGNQTSLYGLLTVYGQLVPLPEKEKPGMKTGDTEFTLGASNVMLLLNTNSGVLQ